MKLLKLLVKQLMSVEGVKDVAGEVAEAGKEVLDELKEGDVVGAAKEVVEGVAETAEHELMQLQT